MLNIRHIVPQLARSSQALWARWPGCNFGIASRLAIAFACVALLAVAANLIVEHGGSVTLTETRVASPITREPRVPRTSSTVASPIPPSALAVRLPHAELLEALGQFDRAVLLRVQAQTAENSALLRAATDHINNEVRSFVAAVRELPLLRRQAEELAIQMRKAQTLADNLVSSSDARRASFVAYRNHFANVDASLKHTLDHTWKIFGRIVARESLITLSRELDEIRRIAGQLNSAGEYDSRVMGALAEAEAEFASTLEHHGADLARSQGAAWVAHLREEFSQIISSRLQLASSDQQAVQAFNAFESNSLLAKQLAHSITQSARQVLAHSGTQIPRASTEALSPAAPKASSEDDGLQRPTVTTSTTLSRSSSSRTDQALIAVVSAAVLLLLLIVSMWTVRSIVRPVRKFLITSDRIAQGDVSARFPRGGIRELDAVAASLNHMASSLEAAQSIVREHQSALELRVEDRTRRLEQLARTDLLTGLSNTRYWMEQLQQLLHDAGARGESVAVLLLDLDNFMTINDTMGHSFGDSVLRAVARRLASVTDPGACAARLGGDEFAVALVGSATAEQLSERAMAITRVFREPVAVEGRDLLITASGGISFYPHDGASAEVLLKAADAALFRAKDQGRDQLSRFAPELLEKVSEKFNIAQGLGRALERNELELVFQPQLSLRGGEVTCVEALLRWRLSDGRLLSPMQFLPTAQESGLINRIGDWVLQSAIERAADWHYGAWPQARVAINVNANQLLSGVFPARVQQLLHAHRLPAQCIEIELTETVLQTGAACLDALRELRDLGLGIALDDFGTGFSSLASLQHLPLTRIKLDRTLIDAIDRDTRALAIANAIMALCEKLGLAVTAEGIERSSQLALLLEQPTICLQGYLLSRPIEKDGVSSAIADVAERFRSLFVEIAVGASGSAAAGEPVRSGCAPIEYWLSESA